MVIVELVTELTRFGLSTNGDRKRKLGPSSRFVSIQAKSLHSFTVKYGSCFLLSLSLSTEMAALDVPQLVCVWVCSDFVP